MSEETKKIADGSDSLDELVGQKLCYKCGYDISKDPDELQKFQNYSYQGIGRWVEIYKCLDCQVVEADEMPNEKDQLRIATT